MDLLHRRITIDRNLVEVGGKFHTGPPKTRASLRRVTLPAFMVLEIENHLGVYGTGEQGLILGSANGTYLRRSNFRRRVWVPAVHLAGVGPLRFHDLRHSHAALLIAQGEHPKLIADRMGHASATITMSIYAHLFPGLDEEAAERMDRARRTSDGLGGV
ncbi:MAG: site-specific integrase [Acidimicrobiia bacterium]